MAAWLAPVVGTNEAAQIIMTNGAQHGLACVLGAIARPGDSILTDAITYQGIGALCRSLDLTLKPVGMDRAACGRMHWRPCARRRSPARCSWCRPCTIRRRSRSAPNGGRRSQASPGGIDVQIIEDDVYRPAEEPTRHRHSSPRTRTSRSMSAASQNASRQGLRIGAVLAPKPMVADIAAMLRINCWSTSPLNALVAARMIEDGLVDRVIAGQKRGISAPAGAWSGKLWRSSKSSRTMHRRMPGSTCRSPGRAMRSRAPPPRAVSACFPARLSPSTGTQIPHAVRINVGAARSREDLRRALGALREILSGDRRVFDSDDLKRRGTDLDRNCDHRRRRHRPGDGDAACGRRTVEVTIVEPDRPARAPLMAMPERSPIMRSSRLVRRPCCASCRHCFSIATARYRSGTPRCPRSCLG